MIGLLTALPNTQLYKRLSKEGRLLHESDGNNVMSFGLNFMPRMDISTLVEGYRTLLARTYSAKAYFSRCKDLLKELPKKAGIKRKRAKTPKPWRTARAFVSSLIVQSFSHYGLTYLSFLLKTLLSMPRQFPQAVGLAVVGHHMIKYTRDVLR